VKVVSLFFLLCRLEAAVLPKNTARIFERKIRVPFFSFYGGWSLAFLIPLFICSNYNVDAPSMGFSKRSQILFFGFSFLSPFSFPSFLQPVNLFDVKILPSLCFNNLRFFSLLLFRKTPILLFRFTKRGRLCSFSPQGKKIFLSLFFLLPEGLSIHFPNGGRRFPSPTDIDEIFLFFFLSF